MTDAVRWGILGTGSIARSFANDLRTVPDAVLAAVGSRDERGALRFAEGFGGVRAHGSYEAVVADPAVDIVYVATPHHRHRDDALLAIDAGKGVLCEKPFAINAAQAREIVDRARARGVFCMEAMWTRFLPLVQDVRRRVDAGEFGALRSVSTSFCVANERRPESRLFAPDLGGGALLDLGVYGVSLAHWFFGPPATVHATGAIGVTGVDEHTVVLMGWPGGRSAVVTCSIVARLPNEATLVGETGRITLAEPFCCPPSASLVRFDAGGGARGRVRAFRGRVLRRIGRAAGTRIRMAGEGRGYRYEAIEAMRSLRAGQSESEVMPLEDTIAVMETLDRARADLALRYPCEA
jgi:predicted dehydrogenase